MPFGPPFSINFRDRLNPLVCNRYNAKASFYYFRPPILASKFNQTVMFLSPPLFGLHFSHFILIFANMVDLGTPSKSNGRKNRILNRPIAPIWHQKLNPRHAFIRSDAKTCRNARWIGPSFFLCSSLLCILQF